MGTTYQSPTFPSEAETAPQVTHRVRPIFRPIVAIAGGHCGQVLTVREYDRLLQAGHPATRRTTGEEPDGAGSRMPIQFRSTPSLSQSAGSSGTDSNAGPAASTACGVACSGTRRP